MSNFFYFFSFIYLSSYHTHIYIIKEHKHLLEGSSTLTRIFPPKSIIPAFRRTKNLKELLAPSKLKIYDNSSGNQVEQKGCFKCKTRCDLCQHFFEESDSFKSFTTGHSYKIKEWTTCSSTNVIYLVSCYKCNVQYVGSTCNSFKVRFRNHKSAMINNKNTCEVAIHFNQAAHSMSDFKFTCIEQILNHNNSDINSKLLTREAYWMTQLRTLQPYGLNKRKEYKSKNRINYQ